MGASKMVGLFHGKSVYTRMIWRYPYFRKPPYDNGGDDKDMVTLQYFDAKRRIEPGIESVTSQFDNLESLLT